MNKNNQIKKMMASIKKTAGFTKAVHPPVKRLDKSMPLHRERDMRQEAMDIGSHGANEMFGGSK